MFQHRILWTNKIISVNMQRMKRTCSFSTKDITISAMVAGLYVVLSFAFAPISYGPMQFRVSEALTLLPFCLPQTVPGLFVGCLISNMIGGFGIIDIVFGSAATLAAAVLTSKMPNVWLAAIPPIVVNAVVVGFYVAILSATPIIPCMLYIGAGQAGVCFLLGVPMVMALKRSAFIQKYL